MWGVTARASSAEAMAMLTELIERCGRMGLISKVKAICSLESLQECIEEAAWKGNGSSARRFEITCHDRAQRDALVLLFNLAEAQRLVKNEGWRVHASRTHADRVIARKRKAAPPPPAVPLANRFAPLQPAQSEDDQQARSMCEGAVEAAAQPLSVRPAADQRPKPRIRATLATVNINGKADLRVPELADKAREANYDVVAVGDTRAKQEKMAVRGFKWFSGKIARKASSKDVKMRKQRATGPAPTQTTPPGGVGFLVSHRFSPVVVQEECKEEDQCWLRFPGNGRQPPLFLCAAYLRPTRWQEALEELTRNISKYQAKGDVIIMGDLNARVGRAAEADLEQLIGSHGEETRNDKGRRLLEVMKLHGLACVNGRKEGPVQYTRIQEKDGKLEKSVIDYVIMNSRLMRYARDTGVEECDIGSDHRIVTASLQLNQNLQRRKRTTVIRWNTQKLQEEATVTRYQKELVCLSNWDPAKEAGDSHETEAADKVYESWLKIVNNAAEKTIGKRRIIKRVSVRWMDEELKQKIRERRELHQRVLRGERSWSEYAEMRKETDELAKKKKKKGWTQLMEQATESNLKNRRLFYSLIARSTGESRARQSNPVLDHRGKLAVTLGDKMKVWVRNYSKLYEEEEHNQSFDEDYRRQVQKEVRELEKKADNNPSALDEPFSSAEVRRALNLIPNGKATGIDEIPNEFLKSGGAEMDEALAKLFEWIRSTEKIPTKWSQGLICTLFKGGAVEDTNNYRGITLLSCVGKLFTKLVQMRLSEQLEREHRLSEEQAGFRQERSCIDQVFVLSEVLQYRKRAAENSFCFFLDVRKAFDTVWRDGMMKKLREVGVEGKAWRIVKAIYSKVSSCVLVDGERTEWFGTSRGVRQGCGLSTLLFDVFIDGLVKELEKENYGVTLGQNRKKLTSLLFADDVVLVANSEDELQRMVDVVAGFLKRWRLKENLGKCGVMRIFANDKQRPRSPGQLSFDGRPIPNVESYKYLGVHFNERVLWNTHVEKTIEKVEKAIHHHEHLLRNKTLSGRARLQIWETIIRPVLEYGADIVNNIDAKQAKKVEGLQLRVAKMILACKTTTSSWAVRSELGLQKMETRRRLMQLRWLWKLYKAQPEKLMKIVWEECGHPAKKIAPRFISKRTWAERTEALVEELQIRDKLEELKERWSRANVTTDEDVKEQETQVMVDNRVDSMIKEELQKREKKEKDKDWERERSQSNWLARLTSEKKRVAPEPYLLGQITAARRLRFKLRSQSNALNIHLAKQACVSKKKKELLAMCPQAGCQSVEDEKHVLSECPAYERQREAFKRAVLKSRWSEQPSHSMCTAEQWSELALLSHKGDSVEDKEVVQAADKFLTSIWRARCKRLDAKNGREEAKAQETEAHDERKHANDNHLSRANVGQRQRDIRSFFQPARAHSQASQPHLIIPRIGHTGGVDRAVQPHGICN